MHPALAAAMTEANWQTRVTALASDRGWTVMHVRPTTPGRDTRRRTTATSVAGWPDLVLIHPRWGLLFIELKKVGGRLNDAQKRFLPLLATARSAEGCPGTVEVFTPNDEAALLDLLEGEPPEWNGAVR